MRNNLYGLSQKFPAALFFNYTLVNTARGNIVCLGGIYIEKSFIMPQIKICLGTIFGHIAFAVLVRV